MENKEYHLYPPRSFIPGLPLRPVSILWPKGLLLARGQYHQNTLHLRQCQLLCRFLGRDSTPKYCPRIGREGDVKEADLCCPLSSLLKLFGFDSYQNRLVCLLRGRVGPLVRLPEEREVWIKVPSFSAHLFGSFFFFAPQAILERLSTITHFWRVPSFQARFQGWIASLRAFCQAPIIGYGWGSFSTVIPKFNPNPEFLEIRELYLAHAHCEFLEVAVEGGVLGLGALLWLMISFLKQGFKLFEKGDGWLGHLKLGLWAGGLAIILDNMANLTLRTIPVAMLFWLFLAITASLSKKEVKRWGVSKTGKTGLLLGAFSLICGFPFLLQGQINHIRSSQALFFGDLALDRGQAPKAMNHYQRAADLDQGNLLALYKLGYQHLKRGDFPSALRCYQDIETNSPFYPRLHFYKGLAFMGEKNRQDAIPEFLKAKEMEDNFDHNFLLAQLHEGESEELDWLEEALFRSGHTLRLIEERIEELKGIGATEKASELTKRLKETKSRISIAAQRLMVMVEANGNWGLVVNPLRNAVGDKPDEPILHRYLGLALYQSRRFAEAEPELEQAIRYDPSDAEAMDRLALAYTLQGKRPNDALQLMKKAISLDSKLSFWTDLGYILYHSGKLEEAKVAARKALEGEEKAKSHALLGLVSLSQGSEGRAREYIEKAIKEASSDTTFRKGLQGAWRGSKRGISKKKIEKLLYP